jgi:hypothetical protein
MAVLRGDISFGYLKQFFLVFHLILIFFKDFVERQKCYGPDKKILFKKPLFDLEVKGQGHMKVIMVHDTPPYGHAPTYQILINENCTMNDHC